MLLPVAVALPLFSHAIVAYDVTGSYDANDRWIEATGANYNVHGSFQPATDKDLKLLPEGDVSDGAMTFITQVALGIADVSETSGIQGRQTYLVADGETWRVRAVADWNRHTLTRRYVCTKYFELG
jgi:hypothetical protein